MKTINLDGKWILSFRNKEYSATVPGLDVSDLISSGEIESLDQCESDEIYKYISEENKTYRKTFRITKADLSKKAELHFERLDTLAKIFINGKFLAECSNIHLSYIFDITKFIQEGDNLLEVTFEGIRPYLKERQKELSLPYNAMGTRAHPHIRKAACHFGWDFAPELCAQGISGHCEITVRKESLISFLNIKSYIENEKGIIEGSLLFTDEPTEGEIKVTFSTPSGEKSTIISENKNFKFEVENPELWWPNGLGKQNLYKITARYILKNKTVSKKEKSIGFRKIELDKSKDFYGNNFQFKVNGLGIFAKGANFIPESAIYTETTKEKLYSLLSKCKDANMNMIRVWGGGFYESDDFYDICDELGLLVWQDCAFACCAYPFMDKRFLMNVKEEIAFNVKRLRHHPSLALWCGNNEIESISMAWLPRKDFISSTKEFFYNILPEEIRKYDDTTPYHPCSPSSVEYLKKMNSDNFGDTHIWNVWHGYQYKEYFGKRLTRFASEFGMQSYPNKGIKSHQKCELGEERLAFYTASLLGVPKNEKGKIYFTQIIQLEAMRFAAQHFRRNSYRCHGSIYWQLNDIWSSASWAGIDKNGNKKALLYGTKNFYEPLHMSAVKNKNQIEIHISNDYALPFEGSYSIEKINIITNEKTILKNEKTFCYGLNSKMLFSFSSASVKKKEEVIIMKAFDKNGKFISENREFFAENNELSLKDPKLKIEFYSENEERFVKIKSNSYGRYICLFAENTDFSDNYFDLQSNEEKIIKIIGEAENKNIEIFSLFDTLKTTNKIKNKYIKIKEATKPMAVANRISRYFEQ